MGRVIQTQRERERERETAIPFICTHPVEQDISIPAQGLTKVRTVHDVGE